MKPFRRQVLGRTPRRAGASTSGAMSTWVQTVVDQRIAEREKSRVSDRATDLYANDAMAIKGGK